MTNTITKSELEVYQNRKRYVDSYFQPNSTCLLACADIVKNVENFIGSGVLVNYKNIDMIITAKHVVESNLNANRNLKMLSLDWGSQNENAISITLEKDHAIYHPSLDLCFFVYPGQKTELSEMGFKYLNSTEASKGDCVVACGYPAKLNKIAHQRGLSFEGIVLQITDVNTEISEIEMAFDRCNFIDNKFNDIEQKQIPRGMSGSGIFLLPEKASNKKNCEIPPKLIGLFTDMYEESETAYGVHFGTLIDDYLIG